ncbi:MAG: hypothetical protein KDK70_10250 [Myxococcales bacterium]|nr:hypothetical protein [Myxococcales bacterium]
MTLPTPRPSLSVLPLLYAAGLSLLTACPSSPDILEDDDSDLESSTGNTTNPSVTTLPPTGGSDTGIDPDGGTSTTGLDTDDSTGTTGEGFDDPGCPTCMVLADGLTGGRGLALDLDYVYFTDQDQGLVHRVHKGGGDGAVLAMDQQQPYGIVVGGDQVYWANFVVGGGVYTAPVAGGPATLVESDEYPRHLDISGDQLYWGTFEEGHGRVMHRALGQGGSATAIADLLGGVADLVAEGEQVFFTAHTTETGGTFIVPPPKGAPLGSVFTASVGDDPFSYDALVSDVAEPWGIAKQGDTLVWVDGMGVPADQPRTVLSVSIGGGPTQELASNQTAPWGIATDEQYVYWTDHDAVRAVPLGGGDELVLAELQNQARSIAVDDQWVYWITRNRVLQRPKP